MLGGVDKAATLLSGQIEPLALYVGELSSNRRISWVLLKGIETDLYRCGAEKARKAADRCLPGAKELRFSYPMKQSWFEMCHLTHVRDNFPQVRLL
ncbi:MAG: hypothetical protein ACJAWL_001070 [Motiliproteus sp.]